ncbi:Cellular retinoic acid-binding protein 2 [Mactra antiquata]
MSSAAERAGNAICGKWKFLRDENTKECFEAMGYNDKVVQFVMENKPSMTVTRDGDSFGMTYQLGAGKPMSYTFKLEEKVTVKDDNVPPMYHNLETFTLQDDGSVKCVAESQLDGPGKIDTETVIVRKGNELRNYMCKRGNEDKTKVGIRVMVLDA